MIKDTHGHIKGHMVTAKLCVPLVHPWGITSCWSLLWLIGINLCMIVGCSSPLESYMMPSGTMKASISKETFRSVPALRYLGTESEVSGILSTDLDIILRISDTMSHKALLTACTCQGNSQDLSSICYSFSQL